MILTDIKEMLCAFQLGNSQIHVCVGSLGKGFAVYVENETGTKKLIKTFSGETASVVFASGYGFGWSDGREDFASMF
jgi:hypothetical protein